MSRQTLADRVTFYERKAEYHRSEATEAAQAEQRATEQANTYDRLADEAAEELAHANGDHEETRLAACPSCREMGDDLEHDEQDDTPRTQPGDPLENLISAATEAAEALDVAARRFNVAAEVARTHDAPQTAAALILSRKDVRDHARGLRDALKPYSVAVIGMDETAAGSSTSTRAPSASPTP